MTFSSTWFFIILGSASYALYRLQHRLSPRQRKLLAPFILVGEILDVILCLGFVLLYRLLYGDEAEAQPATSPLDTQTTREDADLLGAIDETPDHLAPEAEPEGPSVRLGGRIRPDADPSRFN